MELEAGTCRLRPYGPDDRERLATLANDRRISRNMTHRFPYPYTLRDADEWIRLSSEMGEPTRNFAIDRDGEFLGGVGLVPLEAERRHVANVGYWIGVDYWNQGIATDALAALTTYAFETFQVTRLQASVFGWNPASGRVLEKCGFTLEGRLRDAIAKDGDVTDELLYGLLKPS